MGYKVRPNYVTLQVKILLEIYSPPMAIAQETLKEQGSLSWNQWNYGSTNSNAIIWKL